MATNSYKKTEGSPQKKKGCCNGRDRPLMAARKAILEELAVSQRVDVRSLRTYNDKRPLVVAVVSLLLFLAFGTLGYAYGMDWTFTDALYFCVVTLTTVGYGDLLPDEEGSSIVTTAIFVFVAVGLIGAALGVVANMVVAREDALEDKVATLSKVLGVGKTASKILGHTFSVILLLLVGMFMFAWLEDVEFVDALYWSSATVTTVGYGDISPQTNGGKWFAIFYLLFGIAVVADALADIAAIPIDRRRAQLEDMVLHQFGTSLLPEELEELTQRNPYKPEDVSYCSRAAFSLAMLVKLGKIEHSEIVDCFAKFQLLDLSGDGVLTKEDVKERRRRLSAVPAENLAAAAQAFAAAAPPAAAGAGAGAGCSNK